MNSLSFLPLSLYPVLWAADRMRIEEATSHRPKFSMDRQGLVEGKMEESKVMSIYGMDFFPREWGNEGETSLTFFCVCGKIQSETKVVFLRCGSFASNGS